MTVYTKPKNLGDLLLRYIGDGAWNFVSGSLTMPASGGPHAVSQVVGMPAVWDSANETATLSLATAENAATALVLHGHLITSLANDAETSDKYLILTKFDGVVLNSSALPTADSAGTNYTLATLITRLETLGAKVVSNPSKISTQTT